MSIPNPDLFEAERIEGNDRMNLFYELSAEERTQRFVTTDQAAKVAEVTPGTITNWIRNGRIQAIQTGRRYRVYKDSLQNYLRSRTRI